MGEFRRQPSKVWWSTFPEDKDLRLPDWGSATGGASSSEQKESHDDISPPQWEDKSGKDWSRPDVGSDRGSSSSPSQGSHKSQDSGFSDSEIHANPAGLHSPQDSPELPKRSDCSKCEADGDTVAAALEKVRLGKSALSVNYMETAFDGNEPRRVERSANGRETPKFRTRHGDEVRKFCLSGETGALSARSGDKTKPEEEGFKVPRSLAEQSAAGMCGSDNFLNLTRIEGPPVSCSTPKTGKCRQRRESPTPRTARATEKRIGSMSTFATIRKLKGISDKKMKRPISLFPSFNRSKAKSSPEKKSTRTRKDCEASTRRWLSDLATTYEAEIMTTLQSKSLATDLTRQVTSMAATTSDTVRNLHRKTRVISAEFSRLLQRERIADFAQVAILVDHVEEFVRDFVENVQVVPRSDAEMVTDFRQVEPETKEIPSERRTTADVGAEVLAACEKLRRASSENLANKKWMEENLVGLGSKFTEVVDAMLFSHVKALVGSLESPKTEMGLRTALAALTSLDLDGNALGRLVARCEGVRALLAVCLEARAVTVRVMALRALAVVCCTADAIRQFEQAGGLEIVSELLCDGKRSEPELSEGVSVLTQITAPWIKDNRSLGTLPRFLGDLVKSLTRIVKECKSSETLLLSAAALANLTFMEPRTVWPLLENETAKILLKAVKNQGSKVSVFIQEQAATVIANMASVPECRKHLADNMAVVALLCFLQIGHSPFEREPEKAAAERVQRKAAIALSRLCSDSTVSEQVVELQGVERLVRLCKEEDERSHSDGVLVASLAALRKIVSHCGTKALEELGALELVEPRLLDSFLLYSSKQESYV